MTAVFTTTEQGHDVIGLHTPHARLAMVPALGGRIVSLTSARTNREWLWHQDRADWLWRNRPGDDFGASPQAGIDECVPSVAACHLAGRDIPDHGEVWYQAWTLDPAARAAGVLAATVPLTHSPLVFHRAIRASADGFVFDYQLESTSDAPEPYLWSLHPLLAIVPGDRLELPGVSELRLNGGLGDRPIAFGDRWRYPEPFPGVRLDHLEVPGMPKGCMKGFAGPLAEGRAALVNPLTEDRLELRWDARQVPYCGLWLNRGHAGFHHVALEPASGAPDSLTDALSADREDWRRFATLPPRATARWSVSWHLS